MAKGDTINAPFELYMDDFTRDTFHLSPTEQMIYLRALCYIWKHGSIPAEPTAFKQLTCVNVTRKWRECVANVQRMLTEVTNVPGALTQKRVEEERKKVLQIRAKDRQRKAKSGASIKKTLDEIPAESVSPRTSTSFLLPPSSFPTDSSIEESNSPPIPPPGGERDLLDPLEGIPPSMDRRADKPPDKCRDKPADKKSDTLPPGLELGWQSFKKSFPARNLPHPWAAAKKKFRKLLEQGVHLNDLCAGAARYRQAMEAEGSVGTQYVPMVTTWLNQERWREYPPVDDFEEEPQYAH